MISTLIGDVVFIHKGALADYSVAVSAIIEQRAQ